MSLNNREWRALVMGFEARFRFMLCLCGLILALAFPIRQAGAVDYHAKDGDSGPKVWKVLFIGNSYTYFNNLPRMFEQIALSDKPSRNVSCEMIVEGGATLKKHWDSGNAIKAIERGGWDYVVLQEQSTLGINYLVQGQPRIVESPSYSAYAHRFDEASRKAGARTVLFGFWARENVPLEDHEALAYYHFLLGKEIGALVAPVGLAWQATRKREARSALYLADHSHPSPEGTYLAASVLYATCFGAAPESPRLRIVGKRMDVAGKPVPNGHGTLIEMQPALASTFRDMANGALTAGKEFARNLEQHKPKPVQLPKLEQGQQPKPEDLIGDWTGETRVYPKAPDKPATMTLRLSQVDGTWHAEAKVTFGGKPDDIILSITDFKITEQGISFSDVNKAPNGGGVAHYRAAFTANTLHGVTEIKRPETSLFVIGSWELTKKK
jgi:hypothetical protein